MKKFLLSMLAAVVLACPVPAFAQVADTVFPELISGTFAFRACVPPLESGPAGLPLTLPSESISLHFAIDEDVQLVGSCIPTDTAGCVAFTLTLANDGTRKVMRGRSHHHDDCTGARSVPSANAAVVFLNASGVPVEPVLEPAATP